MSAPISPEPLWKHPSYAKLWAAISVSTIGDQITLLALPLLAIASLEATAGEMGLLRAAGTSPILVIGLFAGVWVDRIRRRPVLIATDLGRAALLLIIPLAVWLDLLSVALLCVLAFVIGTCTVFFNVARQSYITSVVARDQLVDANGKLHLSESAAEVTGPGIAGALVQIASAPIALVLDAISFLGSAILISRINVPEVDSQHTRTDRNIWREMRSGWSFLIHSPVLRTLAGATGSGNIFESARYAVLVLYMSETLGLTPATIGLVFGVGSVGYLLGAFLPSWTSRRFGLGRAITGSMVVIWMSELLFPVAASVEAVAVPLLITALFLNGVAAPSYDVNQFSLRQAVTPNAILGRVNASASVITRGAVPIGAVIGGVIGELFGLRAVLIFSAFGGLSSLLWLAKSPVPSLVTFPPPPDTE